MQYIQNPTPTPRCLEEGVAMSTVVKGWHYAGKSTKTQNGDKGDKMVIIYFIELD